MYLTYENECIASNGNMSWHLTFHGELCGILSG